MRAAASERPPRRDSPRPAGRRRSTRAGLLPPRPALPPPPVPLSSPAQLPRAVDAMRRPWDRLEALRRDRVAAVGARAVGPVVDRAERRLDPRQLEARSIAQREVALLFEDLARRG